METRTINMFRNATLNISGKLLSREIRDGVEHCIVDFPGYASIALPSVMFKIGITGSVSIVKQDGSDVVQPKKSPWYKFSGLF